MWVGNSEKNLHEFFECGRRNKPCVLFIDEVDAVASNRTDMRYSSSKSLINQFLSELDGLNNDNEGLFMMGATNAPWHIDSAFLRPGRFDRIIFVSPPDEEARASIIDILKKDRPVEKMDTKLIVSKTKGYTGADLRALFDLALEESLSKAVKEKRIIPISTDDILRQLKKVSPSAQLWFEGAKNYAMYANQSGFYDPILKYLNLRKN
jgi:transitional endoplasmic reticulum ATPase